MQRALENARSRKERLLAKIGSNTGKPSSAMEATPGKSAKRITGKRPQQATPLPATSPQLPTPGLKHGKQDDVEFVHQTGRQLFKDDDDKPPESTQSNIKIQLE